MSTESGNWRPDATLATLRARAAALHLAREFFAARDVLEVDTPALGRHSVTEPHIASLAVTLDFAPEEPCFLQTSPEYAMKRLLAAGAPDIYQIGKVFRDGELGSRHQPEFTMVEWYRRGFEMSDMIDETCAFIDFLCAADGSPPSVVQQFDYGTLFRQVVQVDPLVATAAALCDCARALVPAVTDALAEQIGASRTGWLELLMSHAIIPGLTGDGLAVIHHYPAEQAALARLDPDDARVAERFEVFGNGVELANGYRELTDAAEQRARFDTDRRRRQDAGLPDMRPDTALLAALEHGLPACSGVAVGFDRVMMRALGLASIDAAISFPLRPGI